jgi:drug/metabolite transporter (DMT)-like permease
MLGRRPIGPTRRREGERVKAEGLDSVAGRTAELRAYVYMALMVVIGSSTAPAAKIAVRELPAELLPLLRFGVAGLCLLPLVGRASGGFVRMVRQDGWRLALGAALCVPVNQTFFLNGAKLAPTSHAALIYAVCPLVVLGLATGLGQERMVASRLAGILACVLGVLVIGLESLWQGGSSGNAAFQGDLLLVGAVVSWGAYLTVSKPLIARHGALHALVGTFLLGTALHAPVALATLPGWTALSEASQSAWWGLAYLTLVVTALGHMFQHLAMRRLDASQVATFGNSAPVLTVAWGIWLFDEALTPALALGGALTLGGILWAGRPIRDVNAVPGNEDPPRPLDRPAPAALSQNL